MDQKELIERLSNLSVGELDDLTKKIEVQWGVVARPVVSQGTTTTIVEEKLVQTEFDLVLLSFAADKKINLIKVIREISGLGLKESKDLVEGAPKTVKECLSRLDADSFAAKIVEAGGVVQVR